MSDSKRESAAVTISPQLSGERLSELLSAISEAPDFQAAATFMLAQFANIVGARRALAVTLDSPPRRFINTASIGFEGNAPPTVSIPTDDLSNPLAVSALSLHPVSCDGVAPLPGIPFGEWTAIPFPQPQFRGAPALLSEAELDLVQVKGCQVRRRAAVDRRRKLGHAPGGVALLEASVNDETLAALVNAAALAGPVLARMAAVEERIQASTGYLAEQNTRLQWQSRELEKANRLKSEFLASMSHELRTPINALIGYASLMLDRIYGDLTPRQEEGLNRIQGAAQHLLALINDILDLAKIEAGRMPLHLDDVTLGDIMTEISQQIEPMVKKKALTLSIELPSGDLRLHTDRTKVKQILLNLLSNAVKFTHHGGIWVTVSRDEEDLRFDVRDTGIGIRATDLESIWEDFRQVDQSRTREFGGTGLGLSITRKLVDALGGHVFAESTYGKGTTFTVVLPVRSVVRPDDPPRVVDEVPPPAPAER
jgi:signal transduction histidine kinase